MNQIERSKPVSAARQTGTTLILALVLLLLATLLGLFALNVGVFAQRTSAADLRARNIHQTLEAALSQGIEYIKNNEATVLAVAFNNPCTATDTTFPCGTVPQCATGAVSGTGCTDPSLGRRGNMYYYFNSAGPGYDVNNNGGSPDALDKASLPIGASRMATAGNGFSVNYGVGAVVCMVKKPTTAGELTKCTKNAAEKQGTYVFTVTAVGNITGESANSTLSTTFGISPDAPGAGNAPTIVASGSIDLTGSGTFVTNPNAAGNGGPLTVWTRGCTNKTGTPNSCYVEDFMRTANGYNSGSAYSFATNQNGSTSTVVTCSGSGNKVCSCSTSLSYTTSGNAQLAGIDILSNDSVSGCTNPPVIGTGACTSTANCKANYNVQPSEFPGDLFRYIFGISAWDDTNGPSATNCPHDCFNETRKLQNYQVADGSSPQMGVDEAYLYARAWLILPTSAHTNWVTTAQKISSCSELISRSHMANDPINDPGGIIWDQTGACLASMGTSDVIGWPDKPVILVEDGATNNNGVKFTGGKLFGMVFVRDVVSPMDPATGGDGSFTAESNGTIYGSVIVQGSGPKLNGNAAIVYNGTVMQALSTLPTMNTASPVPGAWTDRYAY